MKAITKEAREQQINSIPNIVFLGWVGEYCGAMSKAKLKCKKDGYEWISNINNTINHGKSCPQCMKVRRWTKEERELQINSIDNVSFISWVSEYKNSHSKANVKCLIDGNEWSSKINDLLCLGKGCPLCAGNKRWTRKEREEQIRKQDKIEFLGWNGKFIGAYSRVNLRCVGCNNEWSTVLNHVVNSGTKCPSCCGRGFDLSSNGYLYLLLSDCKTMCKIGIAGDHNQRHRQLRKATPFTFNCVGLKFGIGYDVAKAEKHILGSFDAVSFDSKFDGSTEWRHFTSDIMDLFNGIDYLKNIDCNQYEDKKKTQNMRL